MAELLSLIDTSKKHLEETTNQLDDLKVIKQHPCFPTMRPSYKYKYIYKLIVNLYLEN